MNIAFLNICIQDFYDHKFSFLWNRCPSLQFLIFWVVVCLVFKEIVKLFSRVSVPFYTSTGNVSFVSISTHFLSQAFDVAMVFFNSLPDRCAVTSHCGFILYFLNG